MAASSSQGFSMVLVVLALATLGGVLYYSINQVSSDMPVSIAPSISTVSGGGGPGAAMSLHEAAEKGDAAAIAVAISKGAKVDEALASGSKSGLTPLMCAALAVRPDSVAALIKGGAKVSVRAKDGKTALIYAAGWANPATVQAVLEGKPNLDERTDDRWTALMMAASRGDAGNIKVLIDAGADVNAKNKWGQNSLMAACRAGDGEKVKMLLAAGANVNDSDIDGMTAINHAAGSIGAGSLDAVKALIEKKVDVNGPDSQGVSPLMRAADVGNSEKVKVLLANGAGKDVKDRDGRSAMDWALNRSDDAGKAAGELLK